MPRLLRGLGLGIAMVSVAVASATTSASADPTTPPSASTWPRVTQLADAGPRRYSVAGEGMFGGALVRYRAALSEFIVKDRDGHPASSLFATSFVADTDAPLKAARPAIFVFNGGPGGSSNTLLFGAMGPERLARFDSQARADPAIPVVANPDAVLDAADLVFIDAPETGFGRPLEGSDPKTFRSNDGDSFAFTQVILRWLTDHRRLSAPVYVMGESYGSIRATLIARDLLASTPRVELTGVILVSQALWYNGPESVEVKHIADPVLAINALPDIAALAWYHGLIDNRTQTLAQAITAAQSYALGEYAAVMVAGNRLPAADRDRVAARLAALTGVPARLWTSNGLRLDNVRRQLLAERHLALGQFDGRETEPLDGVVEDADRDWVTTNRGLTSASEHLAANTFGATGLPSYRTIVADPYGFEKTWRFVPSGGIGVDVVLREQMAANPRLRLMITQGVFDTTTTMGEEDYLFSQIGVPENRTTFARYVGGHMLYSDDVGRRAFLGDVRAFVSGRPILDRGVPAATPGTSQVTAPSQPRVTNVVVPSRQERDNRRPLAR